MNNRTRNVLIFLSLFITGGFILLLPSYLHSPQPPEFVTRNPRIQEAYLFAQSNREVTVAVPCFCGCKDSWGHQSSYDCFVKSNGDFEPHGADCEMCIEIALDTKHLLSQGYTKEEIKTFITEKYGH